MPSFPTPIPAAELRVRLDHGRRRAQANGNIAEDIAPADLAEKLRYRLDPAGVLRCYICGHPLDLTAWDLDHMDPLALGGAHVLDNLEAAGQACNRRKGKLPLMKFVGKDWVPGVPLLEHLRLTARPVEEIWRYDDGHGTGIGRRLARTYATRPRDVRPVDWEGIAWYERPVVKALLARKDPYRAAPIEELAGVAGIPEGGALASNLWTRLMGLPEDSTVNHGRLGSDERYAPSPWFMPTRTSAEVGPDGEPIVKGSAPLGGRAFRLRFRVPLDLARAFAYGQQAVEPEPPGVWPDRDEKPRALPSAAWLDQQDSLDHQPWPSDEGP